MTGFVITENTFDNEKIKLIEGLPSGDQTLIIYFKMLSLACKSNAGGFLILNREIPYDEEMLATLFNRSPQVMNFAIITLKKFGMITETEKGLQLQDFIEWLSPDDRQKELTRQRVAKHREKKQLALPEGAGEEKPKKKKRVFEEGCIELELAQYLYQKMLINNPEARKPNFQTWANDIRLMMEIEKRKPDQIRNMIEWCQKDSFWKTNILSAKKLRDKYDQLRVKALEEFNNQSRSGGRQAEMDDLFNRALNQGGRPNNGISRIGNGN
jgi:predicted phage replisome organizer